MIRFWIMIGYVIFVLGIAALLAVEGLCVGSI